MTNNLLTLRAQAVRELDRLPDTVESVQISDDESLPVKFPALVPAAREALAAERARLERVITGDLEPKPEPEPDREPTPGEKAASLLRAAAEWCARRDVVPAGVYVSDSGGVEISVSRNDFFRILPGHVGDMKHGQLKVRDGDITIDTYIGGAPDGPYTIPAREPAADTEPL
jgi:hypothetical protein